MSDLVLEVQQVLECELCARPTVLEELTNNLCEKCHADTQKECAECGASFTAPIVNGEVDTYEYCENCTTTCDTCGDRNMRETFEAHDWDSNRDEYNEVAVCETCLGQNYTRCVDCNRHVSASSFIVVHRRDICRSCIEHYRRCDRCSEWFFEDNGNWHEATDQELCDSCYSDATAEETSSEYVHSYSYSPFTLFFAADGSRLYNPKDFTHGLELECGWKSGSRDAFAEQVISALGEVCYLKEDGSITDAHVVDGFEIVTHPCELEWYRRNLPAICDNSIPGLLSHNAGEGLGLHISVNRSALTNHAIARICAFIGADRNEEWLVKLARRRSNQWAQIIKKTCVEDTLEIVDGFEYLKRNESRYEAVNLINSTHIEFRLFRGTLKFSSAMLCLEFVNALCRWCSEPCNVSEYQSAHSLLAFAKQFPEEYPHLIEFLCANI